MQEGPGGLITVWSVVLQTCLILMLKGDEIAGYS